MESCKGVPRKKATVKTIKKSKCQLFHVVLCNSLNSSQLSSIQVKSSQVKSSFKLERERFITEQANLPIVGACTYIEHPDPSLMKRQIPSSCPGIHFWT